MLYSTGLYPFAANDELIVNRDLFLIFPQAGNQEFNCIPGIRNGLCL
ncbi:MAG: hypothetical protein Q7T80_03815 [Methanoregula sp.]|nr:hypothetical protein [Methanoregula sp.]